MVIVYYNGVQWVFSQSVSLSGVKHSLRVNDYVTNPNYYTGILRIEIADVNDEIVFISTISKNTVYTIDLTGIEIQEYTIKFRPTNATIFSGFIEKPMLVEGDFPVLWNYQPVSIKQYNDLLERLKY